MAETSGSGGGLRSLRAFRRGSLAIVPTEWGSGSVIAPTNKYGCEPMGICASDEMCASEMYTSGDICVSSGGEYTSIESRERKVGLLCNTGRSSAGLSTGVGGASWELLELGPEHNNSGTSCALGGVVASLAGWRLYEGRRNSHDRRRMDGSDSSEGLWVVEEAIHNEREGREQGSLQRLAVLFSMTYSIVVTSLILWDGVAS